MKTKYLIGVISGIFLVIVLILLGIFIWETQKTVKVKTAIRETISYPFYTAEDKGFFKEKKIEAEGVSVPKDISENKDRSAQAEDFRKWLKEGGADVAVLSTDELLNMEIEYPGEFKAIEFFSDTKDKYSTSIMVGKNSSINSASGLEGKKIGADSDINYFLLSKFLNSQEVKNFSSKKLSGNVNDSSLKENKIDAMWAGEPIVSTIINNGTGKKLIENPNNNPETELSGVVTNVIAIRSSLADKNAGKNFKSAIEKALVLNESEIKEVMVKKFKDNKEKTEAVKARTYSRAQNSSQIDKDLFQKIADMLYQEKYISKQVDTSKIIY